MNAVSQILRVIAILGACAAGYFYYDAHAKLGTQQGANTGATAAATADLQKKIADSAAEIKQLQSDNDDMKDKADKYDKMSALHDTDAKTIAADDKKIADLTAQNNKLNNIATLADSYQSQIADLSNQTKLLQTKLDAATGAASAANHPSPGSTATVAAATSGDNGSMATSSGPQAALPNATATKILEANAPAGILVLALAANSGLDNNADLALQSGGTRLAQVKVVEIHPEFAVVTITSTNISPKDVAKLLARGTQLDYASLQPH